MFSFLSDFAPFKEGILYESCASSQPRVIRSSILMTVTTELVALNWYKIIRKPCPSMTDQIRFDKCNECFSVQLFTERVSIFKSGKVASFTAHGNKSLRSLRDFYFLPIPWSQCFRVHEISNFKFVSCFRDNFQNCEPSNKSANLDSCARHSILQILCTLCYIILIQREWNNPLAEKSEYKMECVNFFF